MQRDIYRMFSLTLLARAMAATFVATSNTVFADSCTSTGTAISASVTDQCQLGNGESVTVDVAGKISTTSMAAVEVVSGTTTAGAINNSGQIVSTSSSAIKNAGTISGDITNTGTISGQAGIYSGGTINGRIINSGQINATAGRGINVKDNGVLNGSIINSGTITGVGHGVEFGNGSVGTLNSTDGVAIRNSGTIKSSSASWGDESGIRIADNSVVNGDIINDGGTISGYFRGINIALGGKLTGNIINSGTIVGSSTSTTDDSYGVYLDSTGIIDGRLENSGTIVGTFAISNAGTITNGIDNTGTLDGKVELGGAMFNLNGVSGRVTGAVTGTGSSVVNVNGTFTTENTFSVGTFNIASGGVLNMAHDITATSGVNNHGTLAVADGITANITGDYTQDGTLYLGTSSSSSYGKLVVKGSTALAVSGTATLNAGAKFGVNVASINTIAAGNVLSSVLSATTLVNNASTLTVTDNSALFKFTAVVNGMAIDLVTAAAGSTSVTAADVSTGTTVLSSVTPECLTSCRGAARVLDGFVQGGTILTGTKEALDFNNIVNALGQLATEKEVSDAVAQTLPLFTAGMNQAALNTLHGTNRVIQARQESNYGLSSGDEFLGDRKFWLKPVASWTRQGGDKCVAGYNANTYGFVIGADGDINDNNRIGVAFSYMNSNVDGKSTSSGNSASINAYQAIVYGSRSLTVIPETELNWQADIGLNKNKGHRSIDFGGLNRVAKSNYDSTTAHIGAGIARNYQLNDKTTITPVLRADYTWIRDESYTETGAVGLNLNVNSHSTDELILLAEGRIARKLNDRATLVANAGIGYDVLDGKNSVTASYVGGGAAFHTQGMDVSPWLGRAGVGLAVNATEATEITARYDAETRSDFIDQTASVKVRWDF